MKKIYRVVAGIMMREGKLLCGKRSEGFFSSKWEFPGGKINPKETKVEALTREIKEEIDCDVKHNVFFMSVVAEKPDFIVQLDSYLIDCGDEIPKRNVHSEIKWIAISDLGNYDWCDADKIIVERILSDESKFIETCL